MYKIKYAVTIGVLIVAICLRICNIANAAVTNSEKLNLLREVLGDSTKISQASTRLKSAMLDFINGRMSETNMFNTAILLFYEAHSLSKKADDRVRQFTEKYPPETYTTYDEGKIFHVVSASQSQASSFLRATMIALERFKPRDKELSEGEKRALEELIQVYDELASVYGLFMSVWVESM